MGTRARHWLLTINNPSVSGDELLAEIQNIPDILHWAFQLEKGEKGTPHFQCAIGFTIRKRFGVIKSLFPTAHIESMGKNSTVDKLRAYCTKEDTRIEGPWVSEYETSQGYRTDLDEAADIVEKSGADAVAAEIPTVFIKYHRGLKALEFALRHPSNDKVERAKEVIYVWGPPGGGKSRYARTFDNVECVEYSNGYYMYKPCTTALFEEGDTKSIPLGDWLRLLDRYPYDLNVKGGWTNYNPHRVVITSNRPPDDVFGGTPVMRRITRIIHINDKGEHIVEFPLSETMGQGVGTVGLGMGTEVGR